MRDDENQRMYLETISQLQQENTRLRHLAETDWLTGLYNRGAIEEHINHYLKDRQPGTIFVFDLDHFKQVNDQYGHIVGDCLLQKIGEILRKMFPRDSLIGRVGGDEFVIFFFRRYAEDAAKDLCTQISERFKKVYLKNAVVVNLSMCIAWANGSEGTCYRELFDSADQKLMAKKRARNTEDSERKKKSAMELDGIQLDMRLIAEEMSEKKVPDGAYCQDYETFKVLYQLELRRMERKKKDAYLILFTLLDRDNNFLSLEERDAEMDILHQGIRQSLRVGDVFTQYSSNQYLVMVIDANADNVETIAERIRGTYYASHEGSADHLMLHSSYPLKPREK